MKNKLLWTLLAMNAALLGVCYFVFRDQVDSFFGVRRIEGIFMAKCEKVEYSFLAPKVKMNSPINGILLEIKGNGMLRFPVSMFGMPTPMMKYRIEDDHIFYSYGSGEESGVSYLKILDNNTIEGMGCTWERITKEQYLANLEKSKQEEEKPKRKKAKAVYKQEKKEDLGRLLDTTGYNVKNRYKYGE